MELNGIEYEILVFSKINRVKWCMHAENFTMFLEFILDIAIVSSHLTYNDIFLTSGKFSLSKQKAGRAKKRI